MRSRISRFQKSRIVSNHTIFSAQKSLKIRTARFFSQCVDCTFKSTKKSNHDILGSLNKPKIPSHCGFPLANPHFAPIVYIVPQSNPDNNLILLYICSANI